MPLSPRDGTVKSGLTSPNFRSRTPAQATEGVVIRRLGRADRSTCWPKPR